VKQIGTAFAVMLVATIFAIEVHSETFNASNLQELLDAVNQAHVTNGPDTIVVHDTIVLRQDVDIVGPGADELTIDGKGACRLFNVEDAFVTVSGITFANGSVYHSRYSGNRYGAAFWLISGVLQISDCVFAGNAGDVGGAIANLGGELYVAWCLLTRNTAGEGGAGIWNQGRCEIRGSSFYLNGGSSTQVGGGLCNRGSVTVTNCSFFRNTDAGGGGGIFNGSTGTCKIEHCSFKANSGGIKAEGPVRIQRSVLSDNNVPAAGVGATGDCSGNVGSQSCNTCSDGTCFGFNHASTASDLLLVWDETDPQLPHLRPLLPSNMVVDFCPCVLTEDQLNTVRPQGTRCDAGAIEVRRHSADLGVELGILEPVDQCGFMTMELTIVNHGPESAQGAVVEVLLPTDFVLGDVLAPAGWDCAGADETIICECAEFLPDPIPSVILLEGFFPCPVLPGALPVPVHAGAGQWGTDAVSANNTSSALVGFAPPSSISTGVADWQVRPPDTTNSFGAKEFIVPYLYWNVYAKPLHSDEAWVNEAGRMAGQPGWYKYSLDFHVCATSQAAPSESWVLEFVFSADDDVRFKLDGLPLGAGLYEHAYGEHNGPISVPVSPGQHTLVAEVYNAMSVSGLLISGWVGCQPGP